MESRLPGQSGRDLQDDIPDDLTAFDGFMRGHDVFQGKPGCDVVLQDTALQHPRQRRDCAGAVAGGQVIDDEDCLLYTSPSPRD